MTQKRGNPKPPVVTPPTPKKAMAIRPDTLAELSMDSAEPSPYQFPQPAPGVLPRGKRGMAMDDALSSMYAWALQSAASEGVAFPGYAYLAQLTQRAEYRRPAEILAEEMTRKWIKFTAVGEQDKSQRISELEDAVKGFKLQATVRKAIELDGYFGRSQIFVDTGISIDDTNSRELSKPLALTKRKIPAGSIQRFTVVEPLWTYPADYNSTNPLSPDFYRPKSWYVMATEVHSSRLLTMIGRPMPDILKPAYMFGGLSLSQMSKPYVDNWLRTRQSVADIIQSFSTFVLKTNMASVLNSGGASELQKRLQLFNTLRNNKGVFGVDKDTEDFANVSAPLGSLDALQAQTQEHMSAVTGIPLSILLGITPHGLNASSEGEIRTFYGWVEAQQKSHVDPLLSFMLKAVMLHLWGEVDEAIVHQWEPLWSMSKKELADIDKTNAETDSLRIADGVISPHEARQRVASDEDTPYSALDLSVDPVPPDDDESELTSALTGAGGGSQE